ncbi:hypothetical protein SPRG_06742 [Saprolegnia parasitica CBS 223.65]|uniref:Peptidase C1A papain C-terminal domain-containing protein n=1 Tax=Saprolegnia parasitica (strain CBS 223.65) TaxID=695850 RepID=A0A067CDC0_SAPPC|nr:hypothetical protein SPRG_06742 [Saprolegnia parasitica CBS 223.65]KDO28503.1 hypothetical protein SPRG_06742 [Saprolegnia parasitica CBS 223.65]|eukprot:XP_012200939.1 hypothetical protein SPRG_06742 [Saprolegnia parasitica CBS 223.65]
MQDRNSSIFEMQTTYPPLLPTTYGTSGGPPMAATWRLSHLLLLVNVIGFLSMVLLGLALFPRASPPEPHRSSELGIPLALLPPKWAAADVTPYKSQMGRGTCWDFASIGYLEWSYRAEGHRRGWLAPTEYVAFSEQAYGISVMRLCDGPANSPQQKNCRIAGDQVWNHSTEGGEVVNLYYLENGLRRQVLPHSVCPYTVLPGNDSACPGFNESLAHNPLRFRVKAVHSFYDDLSIKKRLASTQKVLAFSTPIVSVPHFLPSTGPTCAPCPRSLWPHVCCVRSNDTLKNSGLNMQGEFYHAPEMTFSGGHAMLAVGYNDAFMTQEGHTGGFILKTRGPIARRATRTRSRTFRRPFRTTTSSACAPTATIRSTGSRAKASTSVWPLTAARAFARWNSATRIDPRPSTSRT